MVVDGFLIWSGSPSFTGILHDQHSLKCKKSLFPNREQGQKRQFLRYHLVCRKIRPLCPVPTHRLPVNAGNASEDTLVAHFPLPSAAHYTDPLFAPLSALRCSLWMRFRLYSRFKGFKLCYALYTTNVCVCQELFCASDGQELNIPGQHPGRCR